MRTPGCHVSSEDSQSAPPFIKNKSEQRLHYRLMHRVYDILKDDEWQVRYCRLHGNTTLCAKLGLDSDTYIGTVDGEHQIIYIDFREDVLSTVVHECLHVIIGGRYNASKKAYKAEEAEVSRLEKMMMQYMSRTQATRLHYLISERLAPRKSTQ